MTGADEVDHDGAALPTYVQYNTTRTHNPTPPTDSFPLAAA